MNSSQLEPVYRRPRWSVNRARRLTLLSLLMLASGCASTPRLRPLPGGYVISMRYDVEPRFVEADPREAWEAVSRDLHDIARLGVATVEPHHLLAADERAFVEEAGRHGLTVAFRSVEANPARVRVVAFTEEASAVTVLYEGESDASGLLTMDVGPDGPRAGGDLYQYLLRKYHRGLLAGQTAGIVIDGWRGVPGDGRGVRVADEPLGVGSASALQQFVLRAKSWNALRGAEAVALACDWRSVHRPQTPGGIESPAEAALRDRAGDAAGHVLDGGAPHVALFRAGAGVYLMLFNDEETAFLRGTVIVDAELARAVTDAPARIVRIVPVPVSSDRPTGDVIEPQGGKLRIDCALRPGDAALYYVVTGAAPRT